MSQAPVKRDGVNQEVTGQTPRLSVSASRSASVSTQATSLEGMSQKCRQMKKCIERRGKVVASFASTFRYQGKTNTTNESRLYEDTAAFARNAVIVNRHEMYQQRRFGKVQFDTATEGNYVTMEWLNQHQIPFTKYDGGSRAIEPALKETAEVVGEVELDFACEPGDNVHLDRRTGQDLVLPERYFRAVFHILNQSRRVPHPWEFVIGSHTIVNHDFVRKTKYFMGAFGQMMLRGIIARNLQDKTHLKEAIAGFYRPTRNVTEQDIELENRRAAKQIQRTERELSETLRKQDALALARVHCLKHASPDTTKTHDSLSSAYQGYEGVSGIGTQPAVDVLPSCREARPSHDLLQVSGALQPA